MEFIEFTKENWAVISQAPWAFVVCALLFATLGYAIASRLTAERLQLAEARVSDYKERLNGKSPEQAASAIAVLEKRLAAVEPFALSEEVTIKLQMWLQRSPALIHICQDAGSPDSKKYHSQLVNLFERCGWQVRAPIIMGIGTPPKPGLRVVGTPGSRVMDSVLEAFAQAGVAYEVTARELLVRENMPEVELIVTSRSD